MASSRPISQLAAAGPGKVLPWRIIRNPPFSMNSKEAYPFNLSVGSERKEVFDKTITQSPTNTSRDWRAAFSIIFLCAESFIMVRHFYGQRKRRVRTIQ